MTHLSSSLARRGTWRVFPAALEHCMCRSNQALRRTPLPSTGQQGRVVSGKRSHPIHLSFHLDDARAGFIVRNPIVEDG